MARSGYMTNILLDVVSTGKSLTRITQEEHKHVYGDAESQISLSTSKKFEKIILKF